MCIRDRYPITLRVVGHDDIGIVTNITSIISKENGISLRSIDTSDNVSPMNLIYIRKVGYGVRRIEDIKMGIPQNAQPQNPECSEAVKESRHSENENLQTLQQLLKQALRSLT